MDGMRRANRLSDKYIYIRQTNKLTERRTDRKYQVSLQYKTILSLGTLKAKTRRVIMYFINKYV